MVKTNIDYIARWGARLSTLLTLVKIWELWRDRFRVDIGCTFNSDPNEGNKVFVRNLSGTRMILTDWTLFYRHRFWSLKKDIYTASPEADANDIDNRSVL